jgi:hypothetical protein
MPAATSSPSVANGPGGGQAGLCGEVPHGGGLVVTSCDQERLTAKRFSRHKLLLNNNSRHLTHRPTRQRSDDLSRRASGRYWYRAPNSDLVETSQKQIYDYLAALKEGRPFTEPKAIERASRSPDV